LCCLSLPTLILANTVFFPAGIAGVGICDMVSWDTSPLFFLPAIDTERVVPVSLGYSATDDMAMLDECITVFRLVDGFVIKPAPPGVPNLVDAVGTALRASDMEMHASWC
jgi:hypothetical protein